MKLSRSALRALASNDLIGLEVKVVRASDSSLQGLQGKIVDETMNTLDIRGEKKDVTIDKKSVTIAIGFPEGEIEINGRDLLQRPEERLKKLWKKVK